LVEVEGLRLAEPALLAVRRREAAKLDQRVLSGQLGELLRAVAVYIRGFSDLHPPKKTAHGVELAQYSREL
jgi:hypothetical protein